MAQSSSELKERKQRLEAIKKQFDSPYQGVWKYSLEKDYALIIYDKTLKEVKEQISENEDFHKYNFHLYYTKLSSRNATDKNKWTKITGDEDGEGLYRRKEFYSINLRLIPVDSIPDHFLSLTEDGDGVLLDRTYLYPIGSNPEESICKIETHHPSQQIARYRFTGVKEPVSEIWKTEKITLSDGKTYLHVFELDGKGKRKYSDRDSLYLGDNYSSSSIVLPSRVYNNSDEIYSFIYSKYEGEKDLLAVEAENISKNSMSGDKIMASTFRYNDLLTATRIKSVEEKENNDYDNYFLHNDLYLHKDYYELTLSNGIKVHLLYNIPFYFGFMGWLEYKYTYKVSGIYFEEYDYDKSELGGEIFAVLSLASARWKKDESYPYDGYLELIADVLYVGEVPNQYKQSK